MTNFSTEEIKEFTIEALELLQTAEDELLFAEKMQSTTFYDSVFRAFHSIKGGAGMFGLTDLQSHVHKIESLWVSQKGKRSIERHDSEFFLSAIDATRKILAGESVKFDYSKITESPKPSKPKETKTQNLNLENQNSYSGNTTSSETVSFTKNSKTPKGCIYVVDDEKDILEIISETLTEEKYEVLTFTNPDILLKELENKFPDAIITDFKMPQKTGLELLKDVRKINPDIPVIILSAFVTKEILIESLSVGGFYSVLEKPIKHVNLIKEIFSAARYNAINKMVKKSINLLLYQFSDLEQYLKQNGKEDVAKSMGREIRELLEMQKLLSHSRID